MSVKSVLLRDDHFQSANLYSLVYTLEYLERSYIAGNSQLEEYENECMSLLALCKVLEDATPGVFKHFVEEFGLKFPLALKRLEMGLPANPTPFKKQPSQNVLIFDLCGHFITLMDALKLQIASVGELYPLLSVLLDSIEKNDPCEGEDKEKLWNIKSLARLKQWYRILDGMKDDEQLDESFLLKFMMDTESAYNTYRDHLKIH